MVLKHNAKAISNYHIERINELATWVLHFNSDPFKSDRIKEQTCKFCFYHPPAMSFQAFTHHKCDICKEELIFPNSDINHVCKPCANEHNLCIHCGGDLD